MERYTIEDIELIRSKSGISYEEAVNLLEYHNGNLAKALVDLERNGRMKPDNIKSDFANSTDRKEKTMNFIQKLYQKRITVSKDKHIILNISVLFALPFALLFPYAALVAVIAIFILGYRIRFKSSNTGFETLNINKMVKNATQNVKDTFSEIVSDVSDSSNTKQPSNQDEADDRSFYRSNCDATSPSEQTNSAQTAATPVTVNCSEEGNVQIGIDKDGYNHASVE